MGTSKFGHPPARHVRNSLDSGSKTHFGHSDIKFGHPDTLNTDSKTPMAEKFGHANSAVFLGQNCPNLIRIDDGFQIVTCPVCGLVIGRQRRDDSYVIHPAARGIGIDNSRCLCCGAIVEKYKARSSGGCPNCGCRGIAAFCTGRTDQGTLE
ncbi:MAG: hypothetical protein ACYS67_19350 [Planctomycetota bacterium]